MKVPVSEAWRGFRRLNRVTIVVTVLLSLLVPVTIGASMDIWSSAWGADDWAAVAVSMAMSFLLFYLAVAVNRSAQGRAGAVADAELITSMGNLAASSARIVGGGFDHLALRIPADARAALQHYPYASRGQQRALISSVQNAFNDLAFTILCRADALPRSGWRTLSEASDALAAEVASVAVRHDGEDQRDLCELVEHIKFVMSLGTRIRKLHDLEWKEDSGSASLRVNWAGTSAPQSVSDRDRARHESLLAKDEPPSARTGLKRFKALYSEELTVVKDWRVLEKAGDGFSYSVELFRIDQSPEWIAPWYVRKEGKRLHPVNVNADTLNELAATDTLTNNAQIPVWPQPLRHGQLPEGMRTIPIENHCSILRGQRLPTVCVLLYEWGVGAQTKRLVIDGNHRLAAAIKLHNTYESAADAHDGVRLLAFTIREGPNAGNHRGEAHKGMECWRFTGFIPDLERAKPPASRKRLVAAKGTDCDGSG